MKEALHPAVRSALDALDVAHEVLPCEPALADTAAFCAHYGVPLEASVNVILVASKKEPRRYAACCVLATTRLDVNHTVRSLMGVKRASFASRKETESLTGMTAGGVTVFGLPAQLPIYIDSRIMRLDAVVVGGGNRSSKVKVSPEALRQLPGVTVVEGLALERRAQ